MAGPWTSLGWNFSPSPTFAGCAWVRWHLGWVGWGTLGPIGAEGEKEAVGAGQHRGWVGEGFSEEVTGSTKRWSE